MIHKFLPTAVAVLGLMLIGTAGCEYNKIDSAHTFHVSGDENTAKTQDSSGDATTSNDTLLPKSDTGSGTASAETDTAGIDPAEERGTTGGTTTGSGGSTSTTETGSGTGAGADSGSQAVPLSCNSIPDCPGNTVCLDHQCIAISCSRESDCDAYYGGALNCWEGYCRGCTNGFWDQQTMNPGFMKCGEGYCLGTASDNYGTYSCTDPRITRR